jgi:predicted small lipoprotein YifL
MKNTILQARLGALMLMCLPALGGCGLKDYFPDAATQAKKAGDEAAAIGGACRQAGRSLEDCFTRQNKVEKAGALKGWRDMDEYMRQNKLDPQAAQPGDAKPNGKDASKEGSDDSESASGGSAKEGS